MSFALLAPLGLLALTAWAVPLLLHLVRRGEQVTVEFAALRWVRERVPPRRRVRVEQPWLLALRLALLAALALLLARPVLMPAPQAAAHWIVVAPGADPGAARNALRDDGEWRWLAPGFPPFPDAAVAGGVPVASLLRQLDAELPAATRLDVVVPRELAGLDGERIRLARAADWHVVAGRSPRDATPAAAPAVIAVRHAAAQDAAVRYVRAAVANWNLDAPGRHELDVAGADAAIPADARWLVRLAAGLDAATRTWIERGGHALVTGVQERDGEALWRDENGRVLARVSPMGEGRLVALPGELSPGDLPLLLDADFPRRLHEALADPPAPPQRAAAAEVAPLPATALPRDGTAMAGRQRPLDAALALLAALLFLAERVVATRAPAKEAA